MGIILLFPQAVESQYNSMVAYKTSSMLLSVLFHISKRKKLSISWRRRDVAVVMEDRLVLRHGG